MKGFVYALLVMMVIAGYLLYMASIPASVIYSIYLAGPGGVAVGMALWKGLMLFFSMFFGGLFSILTASLIGRAFN